MTVSLEVPHSLEAVRPLHPGGGLLFDGAEWDFPPCSGSMTRWRKSLATISASTSFPTRSR